MPLPKNDTTRWPPETPVSRERDLWVKAYTGEREPGEKPNIRKRVASGIAKSMATKKASLMFEHFPRIEVKPIEGELSEADAKATETVIDDLIEQAAIPSLCLRAVEFGSFSGGSFIFMNLDPEIADHPLYQTVPATHALGVWMYDRLVSTTLWVEVAVKDGFIYRWVSVHERGRVLNALYLGRKNELGTKVSLTDLDVTANLAEEWVLPEGARSCWYVPNGQVNPVDLTSPEGAADIAPSMDLVAGLDTTEHSRIRDVRVAKRMVIVPTSALEGTGGPGSQKTLDIETREVLVDLDLNPLQDSSAAPSQMVTPVDMAIRADDHSKVITDLKVEIIDNAGFSPQTFGHNIEGRAESGTALRIREGATIATVNNGRKSWTPVLQDMVFSALLVLQAEFGRTDIVALRPTFVWPPVREMSPQEKAEFVKAARESGGMSQRTAVEELQPHLTPEEVDQEMERLTEEDTRAQAAMESLYPAGDEPDSLAVA